MGNREDFRYNCEIASLEERVSRFIIWMERKQHKWNIIRHNYEELR